MSPTRREFLKELGIALALLVMARCGPSSEPGNPARRRLRDCWVKLDWLAEQSRQGEEQGEQAKKELTTEYRAALDELIASGEVDKEVAYHIEYAFGAAVDYAFASGRPTVVTAITCYIVVTQMATIPPTPSADPRTPTRTPGPTRTSGPTRTPIPTPTHTPTPTAEEAAERQLAGYQGDAERLVQQTELLLEMAGQGDIDAATVARAQQAIQMDLFFLSSTEEERNALADRLVETAGGSYDLPPFEQWGPALPPDVVEAARFLVELLLKE